ncbi:hypothetical protein CY34DRAFT_110412 [Suillus luteus UH-Slu-Lm8-n1]|uniref:Uncharacterized protein n=1 Tax=Suillus luteus UH-Slu-Lm8-n1 TaxID=930992 RepID=A0A0C9Z9C2_9AGAM|nr:hypothetical protein CY34DRAFT_110412 [Suillus luteus UH-Slu-Lm8-n1]
MNKKHSLRMKRTKIARGLQVGASRNVKKVEKVIKTLAKRAKIYARVKSLNSKARELQAYEVDAHQFLPRLIAINIQTYIITRTTHLMRWDRGKLRTTIVSIELEAERRTLQRSAVQRRAVARQRTEIARKPVREVKGVGVLSRCPTGAALNKNEKPNPFALLAIRRTYGSDRNFNMLSNKFDTKEFTSFL